MHDTAMVEMACCMARLAEANRRLQAEAAAREQHLEQLEDTYQRTVEQLQIELRQTQNEMAELRRATAALTRQASEEEQKVSLDTAQRARKQLTDAGQLAAAKRPGMMGSLVWPRTGDRPEATPVPADGKSTLDDLISGRTEILDEGQLTEIDDKVHRDVDAAVQEAMADPELLAKVEKFRQRVASHNSRKLQ